jgi:hypothetical protein
VPPRIIVLNQQIWQVCGLRNYEGNVWSDTWAWHFSYSLSESFHHNICEFNAVLLSFDECYVFAFQIHLHFSFMKFDLPMVVTMAAACYILPCSLVGVYQHFWRSLMAPC